MATNWAGNVTFAGTVRRPTSLEELRDIVGGSSRIRALGTGHSFNDIADSAGDLVSVEALPSTVDIDSTTATARVAAGLRYGEIVPILHAAGWALPNLGSLPHISVAGACATGTHGSGDANGNLATSVAGMELVTADGSLATVDHPGAMVGLGAFGVVTHLTLRLVPTFEIQQYVYDGLSLPVLTEAFDEVFGAAYSVSVFTNWGDDSRLWLKRLAGGPLPAQRWVGATLADGPRHPIDGMPTANCTEQLGVPGPWYERLPHFRLEFTPSVGDELQSEFLVPRAAATDALHAVGALADRIRPVLHVSELRTIAADDLWLSPSYQRDSLAIHFTWIRDVSAVGPVMAAVEKALAPFDARPHWGKLFTRVPIYPRMDDWSALVRSYDPAGTFANPWLRRHLVK